MTSHARSKAGIPGSKRPGRSSREETQTRSDELALLLKITNGLSAGWEVSDILDAMFDEFQQILPYDRMEYAVLDEGGLTLTTSWAKARYGVTSVPAGFAYRRSEPVAGSSRYQVAFLDNDLKSYASHSPDDHPVSRLVAEGINSSLNCPLVVGDEVRGYLFFNSKHRDSYTPHHSSLIQLVAGQLASILEQSRLNDQLKARNQELRAMEMSRLEFIASISHELRTPLTAVVGFASELQDRADEFTRDEISQFVAVIAAQGREVAGLVEDLLVITRAEAGHLSVTPAPVNVAGEVRRVKDALPQERPDQETMLDLADVVAWADPLRVRQIIRNLLTNSGRYGGSTARVLVQAVDDQVMLVVADDGPGIPESDREAVFAAYGRCETSIVQPGSIGLGLTVSRCLAEAMGGSLTYDRLEGESRFTLQLPAYRPGLPRYRRP